MPKARARKRDLLADSAQAGDAERLAAELGAEKLLFLPPASFMARSAAGTARASASINAQACSATLMLLAPGRVDDEQAAGAGRRHVDVVHAGARARDDPQARRRRDQLCVDLGGAADQQRVGVRQICCERRRRSSRTRIDDPSRFGPEQGPGRMRADRQRRQSSLGRVGHVGRVGRVGRVGASYPAFFGPTLRR
jgi:hypothetical protein